MQIDRLFKIVYGLLEKRSVTAAQLASELEVSTRTIYRDLDTLSASGIPVYAAKGKGGGIRLMDGFVLDRSLLSEEEQREILTALQSMGATQFSSSDQVLSKLSGIFHHSSQSWVSVDFSDWSNVHRETFTTLKSAVIDKKLLSFHYHNTCGQTMYRIVEPLQLWYKGNNWYLRAYCRTKGAFRLFRMSRMRELAVLPETFDRALPDIFEQQQYNPAYRPVMEWLKLRIDASLAYRVYDEFGPEQVERQPDGSFLVTTQLLEDNWTYGYILSYGPLLEVVEPARIRQAIANRLAQMLAVYGK